MPKRKRPAPRAKGGGSRRSSVNGKVKGKGGKRPAQAKTAKRKKLGPWKAATPEQERAYAARWRVPDPVSAPEPSARPKVVRSWMYTRGRKAGREKLGGAVLRHDMLSVVREGIIRGHGIVTEISHDIQLIPSIWGETMLKLPFTPEVLTHDLILRDEPNTITDAIQEYALGYHKGRKRAIRGVYAALAFELWVPTEADSEAYAESRSRPVEKYHPMDAPPDAMLSEVEQHWQYGEALEKFASQAGLFVFAISTKGFYRRYNATTPEMRVHVYTRIKTRTPFLYPQYLSDKEKRRFLKAHGLPKQTIKRKGATQYQVPKRWQGEMNLGRGKADIRWKDPRRQRKWRRDK